MARINKKHFVLFNNGGVISATTPKNWARANQTLFPNHDFLNSANTPTVDVIENHLRNQGQFSILENDEIVIHYAYSKI
jgi:hypothetical protein